MIYELLTKVGTYTPIVATRHERYAINGAYCRLGTNTLIRYGFPFPEGISKYEVEVICRKTHPGKLQYWRHTKNLPGHVREDSDMRDITEEQETCLITILKDLIKDKESEE
jgi:hypothetical protein